MMIRLLRMDDRAQAKKLWESTFDDSHGFVDWFFENRYLPQWSAGVFEGQELISAIHGTPMNLSLCGSSFAALMTSGVATVPNQRGKGYMHDAMLFLLAEAEKRGVRALFNHPQRPGAYARLGFRPSTFTRYWHGSGVHRPGQISPFSEEEAFRVYSASEKKYSGFVCRDKAEFYRKMADYASDGAKGFLLRESGKTVGYCVYFDAQSVYGEEILSLTEYGPILQELKRISGERSVCAKLPPDVEEEGEVLPQNVMLAPEEIWQALETSGRPRFCVDEY